jgi:phage-related minor tail protein
MIALQPAPLATRPVRQPASSPSVTLSEVEGQPQSPSLEERIDASVDAALAEALAKVKTPEDDALAKQQQAFDEMMQLRTEQEREANAIREFGLAQQKKENDFLTEYIRMI